MRRLLIVVVIVVVLAGLAAGGFLAYKKFLAPRGEKTEAPAAATKGAPAATGPVRPPGKLADGTKYFSIDSTEWVDSVSYEDSQVSIHMTAQAGSKIFKAHVEFMPAAERLLKKRPKDLVLNQVTRETADIYHGLVTDDELVFLTAQGSQATAQFAGVIGDEDSHPLVTMSGQDGRGRCWWGLGKVSAYAGMPKDSPPPAGLVWAGKYWVPVPGSGGEVAAPPPAAPAVAPTESAATHYQAGLQAKKNQDYDTAIAELKQAVALDANLVDAHWVLAWAYVEKKQDALAADEFRAVIRLAQGSSKATEAQAALKRMGQPASAP